MNVSNGVLQKQYILKKRDQERITKETRKNAEKFDWSGIEFPVKINQINRFGNNNEKYSIKVFGYENEEVYPLRISKT